MNSFRPGNLTGTQKIEALKENAKKVKGFLKRDNLISADVAWSYSTTLKILPIIPCSNS
jgi:hypothetical protein